MGRRVGVGESGSGKAKGGRVGVVVVGRGVRRAGEPFIAGR